MTDAREIQISHTAYKSTYQARTEQRALLAAAFAVAIVGAGGIYGSAAVKDKSQNVSAAEIAAHPQRAQFEQVCFGEIAGSSPALLRNLKSGSRIGIENFPSLEKCVEDKAKSALVSSSPYNSLGSTMMLLFGVVALGGVAAGLKAGHSLYKIRDELQQMDAAYEMRYAVIR